MNFKVVFVIAVICCGSLCAQSVSPTTVNMAQLSQTLGDIQSTSQQTELDLARLRIDKWKTGSGHKQQAQDDANSLTNNLSAALPTMISAVRATPAAMAPAIKLYRDLNAVYDVLSGLQDSAGAFGRDEEFKALSADGEQLDRERQAFADFLQNLAAYKDSQFIQMRANSGAATGATTKKIIIDDEAPVRRTTKRATKKPAKKVPAQPAQNPGTNPS